MQVTPVSKTLAEVFRGSFLKIPRFQRSYSWDQENLSDFWRDLVERSDDEYFMGSMVVYRDGKERNLLMLVDGQQRVTTITIALTVFRDALDSLSEADLGEGIQRLIETKDLDNKSRFVLEHDPTNSFFQRRIQQRAPDRSVRPQNDEQKSLRDAQMYLERVLRLHLAEKTEKLSPEKAQAAQKAIILSLRDRLLGLQFISIELTDEDDAYIIFETLNTRGKDLQISDLVKNLFTRLIKPTVKGMDTAKEGWSEVLGRFAAVAVPIDPDTFLLHYWIATYEYVSKAGLFKEMKARIKASNAHAELKDLRAGAEIYTSIMAPNESKWTKEELELQRSLAALTTFRVAQAVPLVFSIMRLYRGKVISLASTKRAIALIEKFAFQFNAITQSRGGGGIASMYSKLAREANDCETAQDFANVLKEIERKLKDRVPPLDEFQLGFAKLHFTSEFTRDRAIVRYVLRKISEHYGLPSEIDGSLYTIEHIAPESAISNDESWLGIASLGNLLFVSEATNGKLGTKSFADKKAILLGDNVPMDNVLVVAEKWGLAQMSERLSALGKIAHEVIWKI